MHITSHEVSFGQKSEITFSQHVRISCLFILSPEPNLFLLSVKMRVTVYYSDFEKIGAILTAQHSSNPGSLESIAEALINSQRAKI